jgi:glycosyltransferase involved in cell wall biosynthesis
MLTKGREQAEYHASLAAIDRVIAVSWGVASSHVAAGVPRSLVTVVANGIDDPVTGRPSAGIRAAFGIDPAAPFLVSVGRLTAQKGYDVLLAAVAEIVRARPDARFLIVGSGPLADVIDTSIETAGLRPHVRRIEEWDDVPALLAAADAVVLPSRFEGLPLVALEAMAVGRPVVASAVSGLEETVDNGVTGRLVASGDARALAEAILALLADPATRARYGQAGRQRYEASFTARRMVEETAAVFDELAGQRVSKIGPTVGREASTTAAAR